MSARLARLLEQLPISAKSVAIFSHASFVNGAEKCSVLVKNFGEIDWPVWII
jgi:hypothetical protein